MTISVLHLYFYWGIDRWVLNMTNNNGGSGFWVLNVELCLLKWSYLISIFSFDKNCVPQLVEKFIHFSDENASEQYLFRGGKVLQMKVSIHQFERIKTSAADDPSIFTITHLVESTY